MRMLGPGRPFIVEISNARVIPSSAEIRKLERDINSLKEGWVSLLSSFLELPMLSMISLSLLVSWQKLSFLGSVWHLPPAGSWWSQWRCYSSCSPPYMLLLKFTEHVGDRHCCSNRSWLFSLFFGVGSHFLFAVHWYIVESDISITY